MTGTALRRTPAGQPDGAYSLLAKRYWEILAEDAASLEIRNTAGGLENLRLLEAGEVELAFFREAPAARCHRGRRPKNV